MGKAFIRQETSHGCCCLIYLHFILSHLYCFYQNLISQEMGFDYNLKILCSKFVSFLIWGWKFYIKIIWISLRIWLYIEILLKSYKTAKFWYGIFCFFFYLSSEVDSFFSRIVCSDIFFIFLFVSSEFHLRKWINGFQQAIHATWDWMGFWLNAVASIDQIYCLHNEKM